MKTLFKLIGCFLTVGIIFLIVTNFSKPSKYLRTENMSEGAREFVDALDILSEDAKNLKDHVVTSYSSIHTKLAESASVQEFGETESGGSEEEVREKRSNSNKKSKKDNKKKSKKKNKKSLDRKENSLD